MLYAIMATDIEHSQAKRGENRDAHRARLQTLQEDGKLLIAGPFPAVDSADPGPAGFTGSLIVAEFDSLEAANAWAAKDPYVQNGTYANVSVKPFLKVFS